MGRKTVTAHHPYRYWAYSLLRVVLALAITGFLWGRSQDEPDGVLNISIVDEESGLPISARLEVLDEQGKAYIAEDALLVGSWPRELYNRETGKTKFTGTLEEWEEGLYRTAGRAGEYAKQFYSSGSSTLKVKPGTYQIRVLKGIEYLVARQEVTVSKGTTKVTIPLKRWINMGAKGWYSADGHLHIARQFKKRGADLARWMQAEDLNIGNMLQFGNYRHFRGALQQFGLDKVFRDGDSLVVSGQENPRSHFLGHMLIWGSDASIPGGENYLLFREFFEEARRRGGLSGAAHFGRNRGAANGISMVLTRDLLSFIEVLQFHGAHYQVWYDILNTGFRMAPTAGSDYSWGKPQNYPGRERFYTYVEGPFTAQGWLQGIQQGRTLVTNGPLITFSVAGQGIGDEVRLERSGPVLIEGSVRFDPERDQVQLLEVVQNGDVIKTIQQQKNTAQTRFQFEHEISEGAWLALRVSGIKPGTEDALLRGRPRLPTTLPPIPALAHSGAIYVVVKDAPSLANHPRARELVRGWIKRLDTLERHLASDDLIVKLAQADHPGDGMSEQLLRRHREELLREIRSAREQFKERFPRPPDTAPGP